MKPGKEAARCIEIDRMGMLRVYPALAGSKKRSALASIIRKILGRKKAF